MPRRSASSGVSGRFRIDGAPLHLLGGHLADGAEILGGRVVEVALLGDQVDPGQGQAPLDDLHIGGALQAGPRAGLDQLHDLLVALEVLTGQTDHLPVAVDVVVAAEGQQGGLLHGGPEVVVLGVLGVAELHDLAPGQAPVVEHLAEGEVGPAANVVVLVAAGVARPAEVLPPHRRGEVDLGTVAAAGRLLLRVGGAEGVPCGLDVRMGEDRLLDALPHGPAEGGHCSENGQNRQRSDEPRCVLQNRLSPLIFCRKNSKHVFQVYKQTSKKPRDGA